MIAPLHARRNLVNHLRANQSARARSSIHLCGIEWFSNDGRKTKTKAIITTGANSTMNQSQFLAIICNSLKAREKSRVRGAVYFGFTSQWLKNWRESF